VQHEDFLRGHPS